MAAFCNLVMIVAAGYSQRFGSDKRFVTIGDKKLVAHAIDNARALKPDAIVVVVHDPDSFAGIDDIMVIKGGARRQDSVYKGLKTLAAHYPADARVLIHDGARGLTPPAAMKRVLRAIVPKVGVVPSLPVTDSLKQSADGHQIDAIIPRDSLYISQTPQGFCLGDILSCHKDNETDVHDDAALFASKDHNIIMVKGDILAHKVTYPHDITILEALWQAKHV